MDGQTGRFVDDKQVVVLVDDVERDLCLWDGVAAVGLGQAQTQFARRWQAVDRTHRLAVQRQAARRIFEIDQHAVGHALPAQKALDRRARAALAAFIKYDSFHIYTSYKISNCIASPERL